MVIQPTIIPLTVDSNTQNATTNNNGQGEPGTPTFGGGQASAPVDDQNSGGNDTPPDSPNSSSSEFTFGENGPSPIDDIPGNNQPLAPSGFQSIEDI